MQQMYCSGGCQALGWKMSHALICGQEKRGRPDDEIENRFVELLEKFKETNDRRMIGSLEELFKSMTKKQQDRFEEALPCHEEECILSYVPLSDLEEDNKTYFVLGGVKYCVSVDSLRSWINSNPRDTPNPLNPAESFTDAEMIRFNDAIARRRAGLIEKFESQRDEGAFWILVTEWDYSSLDLNSIQGLSPKYIAQGFKSYKQVKKLAQKLAEFDALIRSNKIFWYHLFRKLEPEKIYNEDADDLIGIGLDKVFVQKSIPILRVSYHDDELNDAKFHIKIPEQFRDDFNPKKTRWITNNDILQYEGGFDQLCKDLSFSSITDFEGLQIPSKDYLQINVWINDNDPDVYTSDDVYYFGKLKKLIQEHTRIRNLADVLDLITSGEGEPIDISIDLTREVAGTVTIKIEYPPNQVFLEFPNTKMKDWRDNMAVPGVLLQKTATYITYRSEYDGTDIDIKDFLLPKRFVARDEYRVLDSEIWCLDDGKKIYTPDKNGLQQCIEKQLPANFENETDTDIYIRVRRIN